MYQPRMSISISAAQEVARSDGHWKRKLRTRNGASTDLLVDGLVLKAYALPPNDPDRILPRYVEAGGCSSV
jgi:hypothetical protein